MALAASPFGAERAGAEKLSLRSVSALAVAAKASPAFAFTAEHLLYGKRPASASTGRRDALAAAGHHATCILGALGVGLIDHSPDATAAFAVAMLRGETDPGVWYPEEGGALKDRAALLEAAAKGCDNYQMNKAAWMLESKPINLGFGMYLE